MKFTAAEMAAEAKREVGQRKGVYPGRVQTGKMTQATANRQIAIMEAIQTHFEELAQKEAAVTFTAAEKAAEIEKIATIYEATATDFSLVPDFLSRRISIMEAIAADYRKQVAADQAERMKEEAR